MDYPVLEVIPELRNLLTSHPLVILQAPPGAGKSTVLPLKLLDEPWLQRKKIIMLEPRRLAARTVAGRLASQLDEEVGETIGYRIRFETCVSAKTRLEVVTEGILTRMIQSDTALTDVGMVIFDEFHERSLQADLGLALCLQTQEIIREDLRILIMSATLDTDKMTPRLGNPPVVKSSGRQYPVDVRYLDIDPTAPLATRMARAISKASRDDEGDILAFLPGVGEIKKTQQLLEDAGTGALLCPIYGDLPLKKQQEAIMPDPSGRRKIILATAIAETSLTIEGVRIVIDGGYSRVPKFDVRSGLTRLETVKVTRDSADQRAGRAGRLGPGICYRLWPSGMQHHLVPTRNPEIMDADLSPLMLELGQWGVKDVTQLRWVTVPPAGAVQQARELLNQLGAMEDSQITTRGKEMLRLPTHPRMAHMLLEAMDDGVKAMGLASDLAALLEERDPLEREASVDLALRIEILRKWREGTRVSADTRMLDRIEKLATSWRKLMKIGIDNSMVIGEQVGQLLAAAYPERIARQESKNGERYKLAGGKMVKLPAGDALVREPWLSIAHLDAGANEGKVFLAAALDIKDVEHLAVEREVVRWDDEREMVVAAKEKSVGSLTLSSVRVMDVNTEKKTAVLCDVIRKSELRLLDWGQDQTEWQARVQSLKTWRPNESWPDVSTAHLLETLDSWLAPYLIDVYKRTDLSKLELMGILNALLPWELQQRLKDLAPDKYEVPSGSMIKVSYFSDGGTPVMEVRLQEVFGLLDTPTVNEGRTKILLHLLSPGYKPVQVTQDLRSFWQATYHEVRKELRIRYPRHSWPEDPLTAVAIRGPIKKRR